MDRFLLTLNIPSWVLTGLFGEFGLRRPLSSPGLGHRRAALALFWSDMISHRAFRQCDLRFGTGIKAPLPKPPSRALPGAFTTRRSAAPQAHRAQMPLPPTALRHPHKNPAAVAVLMPLRRLLQLEPALSPPLVPLVGRSNKARHFAKRTLGCG